MPPKNAAAVASRRKGPQFNPPRPVQTQTQTSAATKRAPAAASSRATGGPKKPNASAARSRVQTAATVISSEDEQELDDLDLDDSDDLMEDAPVRATREQAASAPIAPPIPAPLLARLLYENFEDPNTQIQKGAMNLVGKYMEIFVREAFARAKNERETSVKDGGISDGFLQVEDLEKLAPQLVLDF
ncbi:CENP-S associating centromere protein X-domain-containing protein [Pyrenochaeta sp. MPI-SDFR-AT-0127]|nr:CENP-S associating centromere protein X-domain-containing protein [Pyrenochaeta sp. MPI-SDFR-AT-0127]